MTPPTTRIHRRLLVSPWIFARSPWGRPQTHLALTSTRGEKKIKTKKSTTTNDETQIFATSKHQKIRKQGGWGGVPFFFSSSPASGSLFCHRFSFSPSLPSPLLQWLPRKVGNAREKIPGPRSGPLALTNRDRATLWSKAERELRKREEENCLRDCISLKASPQFLVFGLTRRHSSMGLFSHFGRGGLMWLYCKGL